MFVLPCLHLRDQNELLGMLTSWNKFCFTTGYIEVSVSMPGSPKAPGLWPGESFPRRPLIAHHSFCCSAAWTMGNLVGHYERDITFTSYSLQGRAGYGGTTEGG